MAKKLIVGLGNPGPKYELNRHNMGFLVLDNFALKHNISISKTKELCVMGSGALNGTDLLLAKPQTYMNRSGFGVARLLGYFDLTPEDLIVIHDDIDLEFGQLKIKKDGGHGGHNGLRSIMEQLGSGDFDRLRIGVGRPPGRMPVEKYVLLNFSESDEELTDQIERSVSALESMIINGNDKAMNQFH